MLIEYEGKDYKSYKELFIERGVKVKSGYNYLYEGYTLDEIFYGKGKFDINYNGKRYVKLSELAREEKLNFNKLYYFYKTKCMPIKYAVDLAKRGVYKRSEKQKKG